MPFHLFGFMHCSGIEANVRDLEAMFLADLASQGRHGGRHTTQAGHE
jgi:hypothetical protein